MSPRISIIVCTYNRSDSLKKTLLSLLNQTISRSEYEILIIDNDSQASIDQVVDEIIKEFPEANIRCYVEKVKGLSKSRNSGINLAKADVVAFIDDDAIADSAWVESLLRIYDQYKRVDAVGGKVLPIWEGERPDWLGEENLRNLSLIDWGDQIRPLIWPERMIGTNASFRKDIFLTIGKFNTRLGRQGDDLLGNEDTEIQERIHSMGKEIYYNPNAIVHHFVPLERMKKSYFYKRSLGNGRSKAIQRFKGPLNAFWIDIPYNLLFIIIHFISLIIYIKKEDKRFTIYKKILSRYGFINQSVRLIFSRKSSTPDTKNKNWLL